MTNSIFSIVFKYFGIPFTKIGLESYINSNPFSHTMYGVSKILTAYGISNQPIRVNEPDNFLKELPHSCIIIYKGVYILVTHSDHENVFGIDLNGFSFKIKIQELLSEWNGKAIIISSIVNAKEPNFADNKRSQILNSTKSIAISVGAIIIITFGFLLNKTSYPLLRMEILFVSFLGIGISYLLLLKQLNIENRFADKLCSIVKEGRCEEVTGSKGGKILGMVSLSEIGMAYFLVNVLILSYLPSLMEIMFFINILILPFSFWSIWYQKFRIKKWCILCICVLLLMWMQAFIFVMNGLLHKFSFIYNSFVLVCILYFVVTLLLNKIMGWLQFRHKYYSVRTNYDKLRFDSRVKKSLLYSNHYVINNDNCSALVFGNPDAPNNITVFSNPYCKPCAIFHNLIRNSLNNDVCIRYSFTHFDYDSSIINKLLIALYQQYGARVAWTALSEWYEYGREKGVSFFSKIDLNIESDRVIHEFNKHEVWAKNDFLVGTPTVFINGYIIEWPYEVSDYLYIS